MRIEDLRKTRQQYMEEARNSHLFMIKNGQAAILMKAALEEDFNGDVEKQASIQKETIPEEFYPKVAWKVDRYRRNQMFIIGPVKETT